MSSNIKAENLQTGDLLKSRGIKSLAQKCFQLLADGVTAIDEVYPILATSNG